MFPVRYEHYPQRVLNKNRTMDTVQNCDSYINIQSSQTYRSSLLRLNWPVVESDGDIYNYDLHLRSR
jgi:hypothetical protein